MLLARRRPSPKPRGAELGEGQRRQQDHRRRAAEGTEQGQARASDVPQHSESFREAYKKHAKVKYDTEVPEHLKPFMGKGSDDPGKSHYYGLGKK